MQDKAVAASLGFIVERFLLRGYDILGHLIEVKSGGG